MYYEGEYMNMEVNMNGIWVGENATVAIIDDYRISFLRVKKDIIVSVLHHNIFGTVGVVYGFGMDFDAHAVISVKNPDSGTLFNSSNQAVSYINNHSGDRIEYDKGNANLTYTMFDGEKFKLALAEKIFMDDFEIINEINNSLTVTQKMALWGVGKCFEYMDGYFNVRINTQKYSILFSLSITDGWVYCRVGQNGYCEKGWAMLSTVCIRKNETRMIENNLLSINQYNPVEGCFIKDGCAFPSDGGWYWSLKEITDDIIYLNGCGETYEIHRKKSM
jgi:hypothetical protein